MIKENGDRQTDQERQKEGDGQRQTERDKKRYRQTDTAIKRERQRAREREIEGAVQCGGIHKGGVHNAEAVRVLGRYADHRDRLYNNNYSLLSMPVQGFHRSISPSLF